jgi:hypothetical protein
VLRYRGACGEGFHRAAADPRQRRCCWLLVGCRLRQTTHLECYYVKDWSIHWWSVRTPYRDSSQRRIRTGPHELTSTIKVVRPHFNVRHIIHLLGDRAIIHGTLPIDGPAFKGEVCSHEIYLSDRSVERNFFRTYGSNGVWYGSAFFLPDITRPHRSQEEEVGLADKKRHSLQPPNEANSGCDKGDGGLHSVSNQPDEGYKKFLLSRPPSKILRLCIHQWVRLNTRWI